VRKNVDEHGLRCVREVGIDELTRFVREIFKRTGNQEFKPSVCYNEPLDAIRVFTRECSMKEIEIGKVLTLFESNSWREEDGGRYVGFSIAPARIFCGDNNLPTKGSVKISRILDFIYNQEQDPVVKSGIREVALAMLEDYGLEYVDFPSN
jgi:hypothetical protein